MSNQNDELNDILEAAIRIEVAKKKKPTAMVTYNEVCDEDDESEQITRKLVQWTTSDKKVYIPSTYSQEKLIPGLYEINQSNQMGIYFQKISLGTEGLLKFPETNSTKVVEEITKFWEREELFHRHKLTFKRGILLWGPPGSGKTCTIKMVTEDIINRDGIVIKFENPSLFNAGVRMFREIEPDTPCIVLMEDIDSILENYNESEVINILDGVDMINKVAFIATTNYPEKLGARIVNRPSRFDKRYKIEMPNIESRSIYFDYLFQSEEGLRKTYDIEQWVEDTDGMSIAHLKELFISVVIIGDEYSEAIKTLKSMRDVLDGAEGRKIGF